MTEDKPRFPDLDKLPTLGPSDVIPEGFAPIKFLPGQVNPPPAIRWGDSFDLTHKDCKSIEWQLARVKLVAAAMNHAADVAQNLLQQTIAIANHQEQLLRQWQERDTTTSSASAQLMAQLNADKQARLEELQNTKRELREVRALLAQQQTGVAA